MPFKTFKDTCTWHGVELGQAGRAWKAHVSEFFAKLNACRANGHGVVLLQDQQSTFLVSVCK